MKSTGRDPVSVRSEARLGEIRPDELTPRQALELLYELKSQLKE